MKSLLIIFIVALVGLAGCDTSKETKILPGMTDQVSLHNDTNRSLARQTISFSNPCPCIMAGSTFLNYFIALIRTQNYGEALRFTSSGSIKKHGSEAILQLYRGLKINFSPKLLSIRINGDSTFMRYAVSVYATRSFLDIIIISERDTSRLVLPDRLDKFLK